MADWYGTCRSNYVRTRDPDAFRDLLNRYDVQIIEKDGRIGFYSTDDKGGMPMIFDDEDEPRNLIDEPLADHLVEGEVLVMMEAGAEKARYITGIAWAIHSDGITERVSLTDIYEGLPDDVTEAVY